MISTPSKREAWEEHVVSPRWKPGHKWWYRPLAAGCTCTYVLIEDGSNLKSLSLKSKPQPRSALSLAFNTILFFPDATPSFHYRGRLHMPYACWQWKTRQWWKNSHCEQGERWRKEEGEQALLGEEGKKVAQLWSAHLENPFHLRRVYRATSALASSGNVAGVYTSSGDVAFMARVRVRQQSSVHASRTKEERSMRVW